MKLPILSIAGFIAVLAIGVGVGPSRSSAEAAMWADGGIQGTAMVGPVSPRTQPGQPNSKPLGGAIITVQAANGGPEIARTVADSQGRFIMTLNAGTYRVVPLPPKQGRFPYARPFNLTVSDGVYVYRRIDYDSGIR